MQLFWRWAKTKVVVEDTLFRLIHKEIDNRKEGFAIFKAHDMVSESHVNAPKKSRSVLAQPNVPPSTTSHYFPMTGPITVEHVKMMINDFTKGTLIPYNTAWRVLSDASSYLNTLPNVVRLTPPVGARVVRGRTYQGGKTVIVGDLHGQLADLLHILKECGMPDESTYYVFNGDFVDRGPYGVEILLILFSLMLACPKYVCLNRGNHECDYMNDEYGFDVEACTKYDRGVFRMIQRCFAGLPLATLVGSKVFVVHGGLPRRKGATIDDIRRIQRFRQIPMPEHSQPEEDEMFQDLMWSDPWDNDGWKESERGAGVLFGPDVTEEFVKNNGLSLVIRSHEECIKGYEEHHGGKLVTVFSASNYDGPDTNNGAYVILVGDNPQPSYHLYQLNEDEFEDFSSEAQNVTPTGAASRLGSFNFSASTTFTQSGSKVRRRPRDEVIRILHQRIYQRRHRLLSYFSKLDGTKKGSVWKMEWVEVMRNVLNLQLPWFFLRYYIAEVDPESQRIVYAQFLRKFHNNLQQLWLKEWEEGMLAHVYVQQRISHRTQNVQSAFQQQTSMNYNEFCSVMRLIDFTMSDAVLFQFFAYFDREGKGHIKGSDFLNAVNNPPPSPNPLRWDIDSLEQFQNVIILGHAQLASLFKISSRSAFLKKEQFLQGMEQVRRGMKKNFTMEQKETIFHFLVKQQKKAVLSGEEETVAWEVFLFNCTIHNFGATFDRKNTYPELDPITPVYCGASQKFPLSPNRTDGMREV
jgi:diadenosine tetraphosphatase ApaH/serine/threonine PP2A family protein phosphatase/Ca2+-binding EF-hand superfamily protein